MLSFIYEFRFVTGPSSANDVKKLPKVFINYATKPTALYLIVYRALSATVCLLVDSKYGFSLLFDFR